MKGLTLIEILVSITILAIILAAIYAAYTSNVEAIQFGRQSGKVSQTARIVLDRMSKDLESSFIGAHLPEKRSALGMVGENREINGAPADQIDFTTLTHLTLMEEGGLQTDLCEIGYYLEEDQEDEAFILYRRDDGIVDDDFTEGGQTYELARMVTGLDIRFQDSLGEEFENWNTLEEEQEDTLPSLIRITLTLKDKLGREHIFATSIHPALAGFEAKEEN